MRTSVILSAVLLAGVATADTKQEAPKPLEKPAAAPPKTPPSDYANEVREMYRVAACGGSDALPSRFTARSINAHCKEMAELYASYRKAWVDKAVPFIAALRPADAPKVIVYPFGGGDLSSALAVFPDATEVTTISLEAAGDIRVIDTIKQSKLDTDLDTISTDIRRLYRSAHSTTKSLQEASHSVLPGTIMFALAGLTVHGMEPIGLRYFDIQADGTLRYLSNDELDVRVSEFQARGEKKPSKVTHYWYEQDSPFGNVEITYRPLGDAKAPLRTYRHIVANLDDAHLTADDRVLQYLARKGKVSVMTKAASFLLWYDDFAKIRTQLLSSIAWMISDASGIPPSYADPAGFEQITYGDFTGPYFIIDPKNTRKEFVKLWKSQPHRDLPFRFGYPDEEKRNHLMITRPKATAAKN
jgi:hypothetical protein